MSHTLGAPFCLPYYCDPILPSNLSQLSYDLSWTIDCPQNPTKSLLSRCDIDCIKPSKHTLSTCTHGYQSASSVSLCANSAPTIFSGITCVRPKAAPNGLLFWCGRFLPVTSLLLGLHKVQYQFRVDGRIFLPLDHILGKLSTFIVERIGTNIEDAISNLQPYKENIYVIQQLVQNDISSTRARLFLRREMSIQILEYIHFCKTPNIL
ncbi:hypothetical protein BDZ45DRAFT_213253 [Acephala macrosclerotiorum]|nr:hypothetical protein BDZ45DRAFT_213253 [Acephala macrosclerotiorum]